MCALYVSKQRDDMSCEQRHLSSFPLQTKKQTLRRPPFQILTNQIVTKLPTKFISLETISKSYISFIFLQ